MNIFCQKHPTENLYYAQVSLEQLKTLMPRLNVNNLKGNNLTVNIRETEMDTVMFTGIEFEYGGSTCGQYGYLTIEPKHVEATLVNSTPIGNQADGGEVFNVTFQSFKKKLSVRITKELYNEIMSFSTDDRDSAFSLLFRLKKEMTLLN